MTYHKRLPQKCKCAHCGTKFESNHKGRLYCCQSCNTLAWRARHGSSAAKEGPREPGPTSGDLPFSAHTVGVVAAGTLAAQAGSYVAQQLWQGGTDTELLRADMQAQFAALRADLNLPPAPGPASFVPAAMRAATGPVRHIGYAGGPRVPYVQVPYHGHLLYYRAAEDVLLWESAPNTFKRIDEARLLAALAATPSPHRRELVLPPDAATVAAGRRAAESQEAQRMAAFDHALREGLPQTEPGPS